MEDRGTWHGTCVYGSHEGILYMDRPLAVAAGRVGMARYSSKIETELVRKSIHIMIGIVPSLAALNLGVTAAMLASGILFYIYCELLRLRGYEITIISKVTAMASRRRDAGRFVLGPVTLGSGALLALLLFPEPAAAIAIYALAFGDGLSSLIGRIFGSIKIPFTGGKSIEGSLTCFLAVFAAAYGKTANARGSLIVAFVAMVAEAAPTRDMDNFILPLAVGLCARFLFA
jgi:phytol kinase